MQNLARSVVDIYFELSFAEEDYVEPEWATRRLAEIRSDIDEEYADEDRAQIMLAARDKLAELLGEPDEDGYTPRSLVSEAERDFLQAIAEGRFDGGPAI